MSKITIIDGNDGIELSTAPKENIKAYMVKGERGSDGTSPTASVSKVDDTTTITITDENGTTEADVFDGFNPTVTASKSNKTTTITMTDINGTRTTEILDGLDLTGGVPTNGVIGFDGTVANIPNGYEIANGNFGGIVELKTITTAPSTFATGDQYYNSTDDLIYTATSSSAWNNGETPSATTLYLNDADNKLYRYYNNQMNLEAGGSSGTVHDSYSTSTTEPYSANYINSIIESGSNSNGSWIKYSDGTMICAGKKSSGTITWSTDSNHYLKLDLTYDDFPQTFISQPIVTKTIESTTPTQRYMGIIGGSAPTTTNPGTYNLITYWNASNTSVVASYIAIGKWK